MSPEPSKSVIQALEATLSEVPELQELQRRYVAESVAQLSVDDRIAWLGTNAPAEMLDELRYAESAETFGVAADRLTCAVLDDLMRSWTENGTPTFITSLLGPQVERQQLPDGTVVLIAVVNQFTVLDDLFQRIRDEHARTYPAHGVRPETIDDLTFMASLLTQGLRMPEIAWEFVYREYPHARCLDAPSRKAEFGDIHAKAYSRVRWLKTKGIDAVNKLAPESSQDSA